MKGRGFLAAGNAPARIVAVLEKGKIPSSASSTCGSVETDGGLKGRFASGRGARGVSGSSSSSAVGAKGSADAAGRCTLGIRTTPVISSSAQAPRPIGARGACSFTGVEKASFIAAGESLSLAVVSRGAIGGAGATGALPGSFARVRLARAAAAGFFWPTRSTKRRPSASRPSAA